MSNRKEAPEAPSATGRPHPTLISDPDLLKLFDYWCAKRQGRAMPSKDDIDPLEIGWALSRLFLIDYLPEAGFRYRLAGAEIARVFGHANLKGLFLADILPAERAKTVAERWAPLVEERCVICMKGLVYLPADRIPIGERLLLPLADEADGPVTGLLGMTVCEWVIGEVPEELMLSQVEHIPVSEIP